MRKSKSGLVFTSDTRMGVDEAREIGRGHIIKPGSYPWAIGYHRKILNKKNLHFRKITLIRIWRWSMDLRLLQSVIQ